MRDPKAPAGLRSSHDAAVPVQREAWLLPPMTAYPVCCVPEIARTSDAVAPPAGCRLTHDAAVPDQREARRSPARMYPPWRVAVVAEALDSAAPAGFRLVTVHWAWAEQA